MENQNLRTVAIGALPYVRVLGRTTTERNPLTLFWTGSGIEVNYKGSELWAEIETDYAMYEQWIAVVINDVPVARQMLEKGRHFVCLLRGMNPETVKKVRLLKEVQAMSGDAAACLQIHSLRMDGELLPTEEKALRLEFVGDSITSGEGAIGAKEETDWISAWFSSINHYAYMTAEALHADCRIISQSGWGVVSSWDNNPHAALPLYYEKVCGVLDGERNKALGAGETYAFDEWQPHAVIVNLGTNDAGAYEQAEWRDETTKECFAQRKNPDGTYREEDIRRFMDAVKGFLGKLRFYNKTAELIWAYGMLGAPLLPYIRQAMQEYTEESGDGRVHLLTLPEMTEETVGARWHPGKACHEEAAAVLIREIPRILSKEQ